MALYYGDANGKAQEIIVVGKPGPAGPQGPQGAPGPQGPAGQGVPAGGTAGQVLTKVSGADYDSQWSSIIEIGFSSNNDLKFVKIGDTVSVFTTRAGIKITKAETVIGDIPEGFRPRGLNPVGFFNFFPYATWDDNCTAYTLAGGFRNDNIRCKSLVKESLDLMANQFLIVYTNVF